MKERNNSVDQIATLESALARSIDYSIALQRAIEHHCRGSEVPDQIAIACPHHAKMLNDRMKAQHEP